MSSFVGSVWYLRWHLLLSVGVFFRRLNELNQRFSDLRSDVMYSVGCQCSVNWSSEYETLSIERDSGCGFCDYEIQLCECIYCIMIYFIIERTLHYQDRVLPIYFSLSCHSHLLIKRNQYIISITRYLGMFHHTNTNALCL